MFRFKTQNILRIYLASAVLLSACKTMPSGHQSPSSTSKKTAKENAATSIDLQVQVKAPNAHPRSIQVATFNMFAGGFGMRKLCSAVKNQQLDVVGLQEVDNQTRRSKGEDQLQTLAKETGLHAVFAKAMDYDGGAYGVGLLSRWPLHHIHRIALPVVKGAEPRILLWAQTRIDGETWTFAVTHFSSSRDAKNAKTAHRDQARIVAEALAGRDRVILLADLNSEASSAQLTPLSIIGNFVGLQLGATYPARDPQQRLDHIILSRDLVAQRPEIIELNCSDHRALRSQVILRRDLPQWRVGAAHQ